jgi:predicted enzyme related to lactoylglutathione lyase
MSQTTISIEQQKHEAGAARVDMKLEVALIPVSDVDGAKEFYTKLGWRLDKVDAGDVSPFPKSGSYCWWGVAIPESRN